MSGQTFVTQVRLPDPGRQASGTARSTAQRIGQSGGVAGSGLPAGSGIPAGSRLAAFVQASAPVAQLVPGTVARDGATTTMDMRAGDVRFEVRLEEHAGSDVALASVSFACSNATSCAREDEIDVAMAVAWAQAGLNPSHPDGSGAIARGNDGGDHAQRAS
jgi:hypothetical protein